MQLANLTMQSSHQSPYFYWMCITCVGRGIVATAVVHDQWGPQEGDSPGEACTDGGVIHPTADHFSTTGHVTNSHDQ